MSRTFRDGVKNPNEWEKPWKATGDHGSRFFSSMPKKDLKKMTKRSSRASSREGVHRILIGNESESYVFTSYKRHGDPWNIDWF